MMRVLNLRTAAIALVAGLGLGGCAYGPYGGLGVSYGDRYYDPYYNSGYGYSPYGYSRYGYSPYGYQPYYGWNDGFYYPGSGYYVYDRYRNPYRWTEAQRKYWEWRRRGSPQGGSSTFGGFVQNWADFNNGQQTTTTTSTVTRRSVASPDRVRVRRDVQQSRVERRAVQQQSAQTRSSVRSEREAARAERRAAREERRQQRDDD